MLLKSYPESVLNSSFPSAKFEKCLINNSPNGSDISLTISLRDFIKKDGSTGWFNEFFKEYFKIEVMLIKDKKIFDSATPNNLNEIKKQKIKVKIFSVSALNDIIGNPRFLQDIPIEWKLPEYNIFKASYNVVFKEPSFYDDRFIGLICVAKIDENLFLLKNPGSFLSLNEINSSNITLDKFILIENFEVKQVKNFDIFSERGIDFIWNGIKNDKVITKEKQFSCKDYRILQKNIALPLLSNTRQATSVFFNKKNDLFSELFYGIDDDLNVKSTFFFDVYQFLIENSQIYPKLNKEYITREKILSEENLLTSFDLIKNPIIQNKTFNIKKDISFIDDNEKQEFSVSKNFDFNLKNGIKAINIIDYNVNAAYNDIEFTYTIKFGLLDSIYALANSVYLENSENLTNLKKFKNFAYSILYLRSNNQYENYNFSLNIFTEKFLLNFANLLKEYNFKKITDSYIHLDFLLNNKKKPLRFEEVNKLINPEFCSFEDIELFINSMDALLSRLSEILSSQKNGGQYTVQNHFKEKIYLDSSLYAISYAKPNEAGDYSISAQYLSSIKALPLLSPYSLLVKDFSRNISNERANLVFTELFKKDVSQILNIENIDLFDELLKNISIKQEIQKNNSVIIKKTTNFSVNREEMNNFKFKIFSKLTKNTYDQDKKKTRIVTKEKFIEDTKNLSKNKKTILHKSIFGITNKTLDEIQEDLNILSNNFYENFSKTSNLTIDTKKVDVHENPYICFLNQIYNGEVVRVEYLSGFQTQQGSIVLKKPIWKTMTARDFKTKFSSNSSNNKESLCRLVLVKPDDFLINKENIDLNLTKLYQNFILKYS